jgi:hypothetical protein
VPGSVAGVLRDTTDAVLSGVTVEASSSALIERVRIASTDSQGQYKIVDLRLGERQRDVYNGIDIALNLRLPHGAFLQGGTAVGREDVDTCFASNRPDLAPLTTNIGTVQVVGLASAVGTPRAAGESSLFVVEIR